ncbi:MAG TPA: hypothetical protein VGK23_05640 [Methanomassiliicoccales archaeon]
MRGNCPLKDDPKGGIVCSATPRLIDESHCLRCPFAVPRNPAIAVKRLEPLAVSTG